MTVVLHFDNSHIWAEIPELPGCFAAGRDLDELGAALAEAVALYLA